MIRFYRSGDLDALHSLINDSAEAYRGVIPADCWREPYMSLEDLSLELEEGVRFWVYQEGESLCGAMGCQRVGDVALIRHAYVLSSKKNHGIGHKLLLNIDKNIFQPKLVGTWKAAFWAVRFYQKHGFRLVDEADKDRLLRRYWSIPNRQIDASVVLADQRYFDNLGVRRV